MSQTAASHPPRHVLVLAAGKSTRFKSEKPKVLHPLCGKPLLHHVLDKLEGLGIEKTILVIGHESEAVRAAAATYGAECVVQTPQLGTGHAVMSAAPLLQNLSGSLLVMYADTPLISGETLLELFESREREDADETLLTVETDQPRGYGRIVRDAQGPLRIVEEKDASPEQKEIKEINAGFACFKASSLLACLPELSNENCVGEYYLTDVVALLRKKRGRVTTVTAHSVRETMGVNDRAELARVERLMRSEIALRWMLDGVTIIDPSSVYIDADVVIGPDTVIYPGSLIEGASRIGSRCAIGPYCHLKDATLDDDVVVDHCSVIRASAVGRGSKVGPFAHLRQDARVGANARIGNFVEVKNSTIGEETKAAHLAYLGDAELGKDVNIGAGAITCNFDGVTKNRTVIEDQVFIGSDSQLIAPVTVRKGAYVAAGSTITEEVPEYALAIARGRQVNKEGWAVEKVRQREERARKKKEGH
jgi:bifunctional UDP-N-acetylglucosamine pyrophosphorylase/glucosamine-1-phosphate N-acetyltransferase